MNSPTEIKIPGYRIEKTLGKGGMATVYLATQMSLGRPVALKILDDPETPQFFERFFNEGRCIARLNHSNLVSIFDIGQGEGFYYIAMEYLPGDDLKSRIIQGVNPKCSGQVILATTL
jgi:serine/threonine-protein kinase PpkA